MPSICPVCSKTCYSSQNVVECSKCKKWVHHGNRLKCSGLTDTEFHEHILDEFKPFECDYCISLRIAQENNSIFIKLPFPVECEGNIFGKPVSAPKPDVSSMSSEQLKKFVKQCNDIKNSRLSLTIPRMTNYLQRLTHSKMILRSSTKQKLTKNQVLAYFM